MNRVDGPAMEVLAGRIRERIGEPPSLALVLGSGLAGLAAAAERPTSVPIADVEGYPRSTVEGHPGRLVFGTIGATRVLIFQGRPHLYEGHSVHAVGFPVRLAAALGVRRLVVTNAAGGIRPGLGPGTLMLISDHIRFSVNSFATGPSSGRAHLRSRVSGARAFYDREWLDRTERVAHRLGICSVRGVYAWVRGPNYETKAEIAAMGRLGADAVGMSTVPEVLEAAGLGMKVLGISTITNPAAGLRPGTLSHEEVLGAGRQASGDLERLIRGMIADLEG